MTLAALTMLLASSQVQPNRSPLLDWRPLGVISRDSAFLVGEARQIIPPQVARIELSPDGRWAMAYRIVPEDNVPARPQGAQYAFGGQKVEVYGVNLRSAESNLLMQIPAGTLHTASTWLSTAGQALFLVTEADQRGQQKQHRLYRLSLADGAARAMGVIPVQSAGQYPQLSASLQNGGPVLMVGQNVDFEPVTGAIRTEEMIFSSLNGEGQVIKTDRFRRETSAPLEMRWLQNRTALGMRVERGSLESGGVQSTWLIYDPGLGQLENSEDIPPPPQQSTDLSIVSQEHSVEFMGSTSRVNALWLMSSSPGEEARALISTDTGPAALSPESDLLVYTQGGALMLRRLTKMPMPLYRQQQIDTIQRRAMWYASDVSQALMRYWTDHGERFPSPAEFAERLNWLVRDVDSLQYFTYTHPGGGLPNGGVASQVQMGYVEASIGRATLMMDGQIQWSFKPNR